MLITALCLSMIVAVLITIFGITVIGDDPKTVEAEAVATAVFLVWLMAAPALVAAYVYSDETAVRTAAGWLTGQALFATIRMILTIGKRNKKITPLGGALGTVLNMSSIFAIALIMTYAVA